MKSIKKSLRYTIRLAFLLSLCVGVQIAAPRCAKEDQGPDTSTISTVYTPTNDYQVVGVIAGLGFFGCAQVTVADANGNAITNATVEVNNKILPYDADMEAYTDDDETTVLDYDEGKIYELTITIDNNIIAEGIAQMPTTPEITSPTDSATHQLNQPLAVHLNKVKYATAVNVLVETPYRDADGNWVDDTTYAFEVASGQQQVTIPSDVFNTTGWYELSVEAVSGITSSVSLFEDEIVSFDAGYNIKGPRGVFVAQALGSYISVYIPSSGSQTATFEYLYRRQSSTPQLVSRWERQWRHWRREFRF